MRKFDKKLNINKVNILSEQRYLAGKELINENIDEEYYDDLKPLDGYIDAEEIIGEKVWVHTNRTHRNQGKNGMVGIYTVTKNGTRGSLTNKYTNEIRLESPIYFQTSETGAERIKQSKIELGGAGKRVLIAGVSGVVIPTRNGDTNGMLKIQFNPFDESSWFYGVGDAEKKEIISGSEVYFNATKGGDWEIYVKDPIYAEQKSLKEPQEKEEPQIEIN